MSRAQAWVWASHGSWFDMQVSSCQHVAELFSSSDSDISLSFSLSGRFWTVVVLTFWRMETFLEKLTHEKKTKQKTTQKTHAEANKAEKQVHKGVSWSISHLTTASVSTAMRDWRDGGRQRRRRRGRKQMNYKLISLLKNAIYRTLWKNSAWLGLVEFVKEKDGSMHISKDSRSFHSRGIMRV